MDGVPMVSQCPILEGQTFRYSYLAETPGTYFWHSHDGMIFVIHCLHYWIIIQMYTTLLYLCLLIKPAKVTFIMFTHMEMLFAEKEHPRFKGLTSHIQLKR